MNKLCNLYYKGTERRESYWHRNAPAYKFRLFRSQITSIYAEKVKALNVAVKPPVTNLEDISSPYFDRGGSTSCKSNDKPYKNFKKWSKKG